VVDLLADSGIEAMTFKGPMLAVQAYRGSLDEEFW
jgi:hypothetical protein